MYDIPFRRKKLKNEKREKRPSERVLLARCAVFVHACCILSRAVLPSRVTRSSTREPLKALLYYNITVPRLRHHHSTCPPSGAAERSKRFRRADTFTRGNTHVVIRASNAHVEDSFSFYFFISIFIQSALNAFAVQQARVKLFIYSRKKV